MGEKEIVFIDANIFLEFILGDQQALRCKEFLEQIRNFTIFAYTSDFIIYSCLLQIERKLKSRLFLHDFLLLLSDCSIKIIRPSLQDISLALKLVDKEQLDFDDSLVVSCMVKNNIKTLISLDKDFDRIHIIKRLEP